MFRRFAVMLLLASLAASTYAGKTQLKTIHVAGLAAALKSSTPPTVFDANVPIIRQKVGVIPTAQLLSSSSKYDVVKELPADKKTALVFYCANTLCTASNEAARRAISAGYTNASVMVDGIFGWRKAGQPIAPIVGNPTRLEPKTVAAMVAEKGAEVIDVREDEERFEIVPGALSFPYSGASDEKKWSAFVSSLPKNKVAVFYCAAGVRSKRAAEKISTRGLPAGYFDSEDQWKAAGLPIAKGPAK